MVTSEGLGAVFVAHLQDGPGDRAVPEGLDGTLGRLWEAGSAAWPGIDLDPPRFVRHLAEHVAPDAGLEAALAGVHAGDLYLACALSHRVDGAHQRFEDRFAGAIPAFTRRVDDTPAFADEVRQELRRRLFVSEGDGPPRIAGYSGRGPLSAWVGVVARSIALNMIRSRKTDPVAESSDDTDALTAGADPELDYLRLRYRDEFRKAFQDAIAGLDRRDRMILRLCYVKGLSHDRIAVAYGVHQTTISRRIGKAREALVEGIQSHLRQRLQTSTVDLDSIARLVGSQLDLSLTRWLGEEDPL